MNHWIILPIVLPAVLAPFIIMVLRHHLDLQRIFSIAGTLALVAVTLGLMGSALGGDIQVYELGDWPAPFGIVLVLDRLSAMMIVLTALLGLAVLLHAIGSGWDKRGWHFHALFQFQLMGIMGAFLTGDAFNLFVFFEVLLIASYGLMIHGGGAVRLQAGVQYVGYNLLGSTMFLFALGILYNVTGTLNMADLAVRVADFPAQDTALLRIGAILLLLVFAIKAAVLPLHFWLPASYANAPAPVAALFAIMTKVGAYAILRMYTLVFGPDVAASAGLVTPWLMPAAVLTLAVGMIGILGSRQLARMVAFAAIGSMGTLLIAISMFTPEATTAALYYIIHSTFATALLFLIVDLVTERRGDQLKVNMPMPQSGLIACLFFAGAIAMAGMPPLSGFVGKLLVMNASWDSPLVLLIWATILVTSFIAIVGLARAGSILFWKPFDATLTLEAPEPSKPAILSFVACFALLAMLIALTVFAGPVLDYVGATSEQLFATQDYIDAVLNRDIP
ncbi:multicomponent K+:H+ antiporter subunit D [Monaibacterium marinum]|uniref:Multicomponent K+:H+ antiporter subunit D n=1 Tax=Pontivivens marinum TaxID=1690039 RepID=A0A2C9CRM6_9RHOB|nr:monovalent cation/H+ antiporter subunit D [Monaibacterium marinum]SOH93815.1 multicomponent K+:H+ antiporter subunit D [Monaibacterium marinum]